MPSRRASRPSPVHTPVPGGLLRTVTLRPVDFWSLDHAVPVSLTHPRSPETEVGRPPSPSPRLSGVGDGNRPGYDGAALEVEGRSSRCPVMAGTVPLPGPGLVLPRRPWVCYLVLNRYFSFFPTGGCHSPLLRPRPMPCYSKFLGGTVHSVVRGFRPVTP